MVPRLCLLSYIIAFCLNLVASAESHEANIASEASARRNANHIFNTLHSAARQWGSSYHHNGMSMFLASIPAGTLFYHGTQQAERVTGWEWLAFEIELAELHAGAQPENPSSALVQQVHTRPREHGRTSISQSPPETHYLHTYKTPRPLTRLIYLDGESAAKTSDGTLDIQDILLLNSSSVPMHDEDRGRLLCELGEGWGIEGFVRMQEGFELILCDFRASVDLVSVRRRPSWNESRITWEQWSFEWVRGVTERYAGIDAGRLDVDFSTMVSAFNHPINFTNPDPRRSKLPRLVNAKSHQLRSIMDDFSAMMRRGHSTQIAPWQGIVDMILKRYSRRLEFLASDISSSTFFAEIDILLDIFVDYDQLSTGDPIDACTNHYLQPIDAIRSTLSAADTLIMAAVVEVSNTICKTLFAMRRTLLGAHQEVQHQELQDLQSCQQQIKSLMSWLDWSSFKGCGQCAPNEICFMAFWEWGGEEDHYHPACRNSTYMMHSFHGYWHSVY